MNNRVSFNQQTDNIQYFKGARSSKTLVEKSEHRTGDSVDNEQATKQNLHNNRYLGNLCHWGSLLNIQNAISSLDVFISLKKLLKIEAMFLFLVYFAFRLKIPNVYFCSLLYS